MSILNCASSASVYRGYDYYVNKHVTDIIKINSSLYEELKQNTKRTLDKYLKETYNKYIKDNKSWIKYCLTQN